MRIKLAAIAVLAFLACSCGGNRNNSASDNQPYTFDPATAPELTVKGTIPDGTISWSGIDVPKAPEFSDAVRTSGLELFKKACAACHGDSGKGDGPLVEKVKMPTKPADLTRPIDSIKFHTTKAGTMPNDEDIFRTITRGIPRTAMPSFRNLSADERWALVAHVKSLWTDPRLEKWKAVPITIPRKLPPSDDLRLHGRTVFNTYCNKCHGDNGDARSGSFVGRNDVPGAGFARFGGKYMLGGNSDEDIARTLITGLGGKSQMMSFEPVFFGEESTVLKTSGDKALWGTVYYVQELINAGK